MHHTIRETAQTAIATPVAQTSKVIAMLAPSLFDISIGRNPANRMMPAVNRAKQSNQTGKELHKHGSGVLSVNSLDFGEITT